MLKYASLIVVVVLLSIFSAMNPGPDKFKDYMELKIEEKAKEEGEIVGILGNLFSDKLSEMLNENTLRKNYLLFSIYEIDDLIKVEDKELRYLGVLGKFYKL